MIIILFIFSIIIISILFIYLFIYGEFNYTFTYYDFSTKIKNYKIKKVIHEDSTVTFEPWGKLKYKPWRWKHLGKMDNNFECFLYTYKCETFDEAVNICKKYINYNLNKNIVKSEYFYLNENE